MKEVRDWRAVLAEKFNQRFREESKPLVTLHMEGIEEEKTKLSSRQKRKLNHEEETRTSINRTIELLGAIQRKEV